MAVLVFQSDRVMRAEFARLLFEFAEPPVKIRLPLKETTMPIDQQCRATSGIFTE